MGNQPSKKSESKVKKDKKNKPEKVKDSKEGENIEVNPENKYIERFPLLALFSSNEKVVLKNLFLALCDAKLEIEEGKEIQNHELEEKIISQGEIKEEKFIVSI